jgi:hypothetical protein
MPPAWGMGHGVLGMGMGYGAWGMRYEEKRRAQGAGLRARGAG